MSRYVNDVKYRWFFWARTYFLKEFFYENILPRGFLKYFILTRRNKIVSFVSNFVLFLLLLAFLCFLVVFTSLSILNWFVNWLAVIKFIEFSSHTRLCVTVFSMRIDYLCLDKLTYNVHITLLPIFFRFDVKKIRSLYYVIYVYAWSKSLTAEIFD